MTITGTIVRRFVCSAIALSSLITLQSSFAAQSRSTGYAGWKISKTEWSSAEEENYSRYVAMIGQGVARGLCSTVSSCFKNPAVNPYASSDPGGLRFFSDCADFPYFLRAYYAWRNQLPFGYVLSVRPIQGGPETTKDIRYSPFGNVVKQRYSVIVGESSNGTIQFPNALKIFNNVLSNQISSAHFRVSYSGMDADEMFSDFYPVKITRGAIRPGTTIYDASGHVVTVYKITNDGRVYYIDAHPDNSLTSGIFNSRFMRSYPGQGAGFKNWRPIALVDATYTPAAGYVGGRIVGAKDRDLPDYGTEQYYGTNRNPEWKQSQFSFEGRPMNFYEFVRNRLANGPLIVNPVDDVRVMADELCASVKERATAVQVAVTAGIHDRPHPEKLPNNIYGADGEWETYATPARDARLKVAFKEIRDYVESALGHQQAQDGKISYQGSSLARDMMNAYKQSSNACKVVYKNSVGGNVTLSLEEVRSRVYDLSFDPYHCPELRWGAKGSEAQTCRMDASKRAWYEGERWLRFQHERNTDAFTGVSVYELTGPQVGGGIANGQDLDIIAFLTRYQ